MLHFPFKLSLLAYLPKLNVCINYDCTLGSAPGRYQRTCCTRKIVRTKKLCPAPQLYNIEDGNRSNLSYNKGMNSYLPT
jgi:hypothetical protein